jgi:diguanylate cyclase (GGDEF)-like protein
MYEMLLRIQHVYLQEKLRKMSNTVELTGLYKRRRFFAIAQHQLKVANRKKEVIIALIFADLDKFESINDEWRTHQTGDEALEAMAGVLLQPFRESDVI